MILVTLGTQDKSFKRLLDAIQNEIDKGNIKDKVIVQAGCSADFKSNDMQIFDYIPMDEFEKLMQECDILITHGGVGSITTGLRNNKKVIAAARLKKYKEHVNDHQLDIIKSFSDSGHIVGLSSVDELGEALKKVKDFKPKQYIKNTGNSTLESFKMFERGQYNGNARGMNSAGRFTTSSVDHV